MDLTREVIFLLSFARVAFGISDRKGDAVNIVAGNVDNGSARTILYIRILRSLADWWFEPLWKVALGTENLGLVF